ncbi:WD40 repeat domain-containing protein [Hyalangium versicolor]|uniref:WD40 repeat domain-containing protein n=1 Tax=Hyalangium versicolor TaxID=2861190 RepID=UPI001CCA8F0D|nr:hypothetical protein [Hyalangium versicolor]
MSRIWKHARKAFETLSEARTPGEQRLACAIAAAEAEDEALATLILASAHLIEHTGAQALAREMLWPPSPWAASAREWLAGDPLHLLPRWRSRQRLAPGAFLGQLAGGDGGIGGMAFSADGQRLLAHFSGDLDATLAQELGATGEPWGAWLVEWDANSGAPLRARPAGQFREGASVLAVSADGSRVLVRDHRSVLLLDARTLMPVETRRGAEGPWAAAFAGSQEVWLDGSTLVIQDGEVRHEEPSAGMWALAVDTSRERVAVAGNGRAAGLAVHRLTDARIERLLAPGALSQGLPVFSTVAFRPKHEEVFLGGWDKQVWRWPLEQARPTVVGPQEGPLSAGLFSADGSLYASADGAGVICLWNAGTGERRARFQAHSGEVSALAVAPRTGELLSAGAEGTVRRWPPLPVLAAAGWDVRAPHGIARSPLSARIGRSLLEDAVCTAFGEETRQWAPDGTPRGPAVRGVEWLPAAEQSWSGDVLQVSTRYRKAHLSGYAGARIRAADVSREAPRAAVAMGSTVVLHDTQDGAVLETWAIDEPVVALAFLGRDLVAVDAQGHVLVWELGS